MNKQLRNHSTIFRLFAHDKPDKTGSLLQRLGVFGFTASFTASLLLLFLDVDLNTDTPLARFLVFIFIAGWFCGLFMFIATGIHYAGRQKGKTTFLSSTAYMFRKTFLYLFLPAIVLTALLILWAVITQQPTFR